MIYFPPQTRQVYRCTWPFEWRWSLIGGCKAWYGQNDIRPKSVCPGHWAKAFAGIYLYPGWRAWVSSEAVKWMWPYTPNWWGCLDNRLFQWHLRWLHYFICTRKNSRAFLNCHWLSAVLYLGEIGIRLSPGTKISISPGKFMITVIWIFVILTKLWSP